MNMLENFWRRDHGYAFVSGLFALLVALLGIFAFWLFAKIYFIPELGKKAEKAVEIKAELKRESLADLQNKHLIQPLLDNGFEIKTSDGRLSNFGEKIVSNAYPVPPQRHDGTLVVGRISFEDNSTAAVVFSCGDQSDCGDAVRRFEQITQDYKDARNAWEVSSRPAIIAPLPFFVPLVR